LRVKCHEIIYYNSVLPREVELWRRMIVLVDVFI
jgi:hypothetical protein